MSKKKKAEKLENDLGIELNFDDTIDPDDGIDISTIEPPAPVKKTLDQEEAEIKNRLATIEKLKNAQQIPFREFLGKGMDKTHEVLDIRKEKNGQKIITYVEKEKTEES